MKSINTLPTTQIINLKGKIEHINEKHLDIQIETKGEEQKESQFFETAIDVKNWFNTQVAIGQ